MGSLIITLVIGGLVFWFVGRALMIMFSYKQISDKAEAEKKKEGDGK